MKLLIILLTACSITIYGGMPSAGELQTIGGSQFDLGAAAQFGEGGGNLPDAGKLADFNQDQFSVGGASQFGSAGGKLPDVGKIQKIGQDKFTLGATSQFGPDASKLPDAGKMASFNEKAFELGGVSQFGSGGGNLPELGKIQGIGAGLTGPGLVWADSKADWAAREEAQEFQLTDQLNKAVFEQIIEMQPEFKVGQAQKLDFAN